MNTITKTTTVDPSRLAPDFDNIPGELIAEEFPFWLGVTADCPRGQIDVVVVNAGIIRIATVDAFTLEDLDLMLAVNVRGVFLAIQAAASHMRDGGRIITIGSNTAVRTGTPGASVYAMTKAAVASMAKGVALDLAPRGITVNNIQPGPTETDMTAGMIPQLREMIPLRRVGQPAEIAGLISYLTSDQAGYMTGASLTIDGGFVL